MHFMGNNNINPALQVLTELIGTWEMELSNASFLPGPTEIIKGTATFEWFEGGDFLILRQGTKKKETPWATWIIGHDHDSLTYTVLYIDDRRFSRVYEMNLKSVDDLKKLKNTNGSDLHVWGSGKLIQLLLKNDLVDEFRLVIYPLTLGRGQKLFAEGTCPAAFAMTECSVTPSGVIMASYNRAGEVKTGTVGA